MSTTLGRYRILAKLAQGGMGNVYLAALGGPGAYLKLAVLKTLKASLAADDRPREAFMQEARLSARLQHPNIVAAYEVFEADCIPVMALEYLEGQPLDRLRREHATALPLSLHLHILTEVLRGLEYFHDLEDIDGTPLHPVHRDISPQNIFVTYAGEVKVLDFGIAKAAHLAGTEETEVGVFKGKVRYMAAEQMRIEVQASLGLDRRTDLYAVGVLLWEALAGRSRWDGLGDADIVLELMRGESPSLAPEISGLSGEARAVVQRAMARAPSGRFASAGEMRDAVLTAFPTEMSNANADALARWMTARYAGAQIERRRLIADRLTNLEPIADDASPSSWPDEPPTIAAPAPVRRRTALRSADRHLPASLSGFVGRQTELAAIRALLQRTRLLTLTGPGGIGKTRLTVEVARLSAGQFADGARFVALGATSDATLVTSAIAAVLGVSENPTGAIRDSLLLAIREKEILLVLDNFEHVLAAAPLVSALLAAAPATRVLVSSREPLRLSGEHVFAVPPLSVPDRAPAEEAMRHAAVELFVARAQAVKFGFTLGPDNVDHVIRICRQLDGLPLAIEIAAARVDRFDLAELLRTSQSSLLEVEGPLDLPERQRTLRHVIGWSYSLLLPEAQRLFRHLSVFAGGATTDAVAHVCATDATVEELLDALVSKSLVRTSPSAGGSARYGLLETIRAFASDEIRAHAEESAACARHAEYYADLAVHEGRRLELASQREALEGLDLEAANLRLALARLEEAAPHRAAEVALALARFWELRGFWSEGLRRFEAIGRLACLAAPDRARCLAWAGRLTRLRGDQHGAAALLDEAMALASQSEGAEPVRPVIDHERGLLAMALVGDSTASVRCLESALRELRQFGDNGAIAEALVSLAFVHYHRGERDKAQELGAEAIGIARRRGNPRLIAGATNILGLAARAQGDYAAANSFFEQQLAVSEAADDKPGILEALINMAEFARSRSDMTKAEAMYQRYIAICQDLGNPFPTARAIKDLGEIARYRGDDELACDLYERALGLAEESGNINEASWVRRALAEIAMRRGQTREARKHFVAAIRSSGNATQTMLLMLCLNGLAAVAGLEGQDARAARLIGTAEPLFDRNGPLLAAEDLAEYEGRVASIRQRLEPDLYEQERGAGRALSLPEIIDFACAASAQDPTQVAERMGEG